MSTAPTAPIRLAALPRNADHAFLLQPEAEARSALATALGLQHLRKLRFSATLHPLDGEDWRLEGQLGATVVQPCVVTGAPVTTRIDTEVIRNYLADAPEPTEAEAEMPEDDTVEPLPRVLDLESVMREALALELPDYPRAPEAEPVSHSARPPGAEPISEEKVKPFAALASLRDKLSGGSQEE